MNNPNLFFYQSGPINYIKVDYTNPIHLELLNLLPTLGGPYKEFPKAAQRRVNLLAKKIGLRAHFHHSTGRTHLSSDLFLFEKPVGFQAFISTP